MRARLLALLAALLLALWLAPGAVAAVTVDAPPERASAQETAEPEEEAAESLRGTLRGPDRQPLAGVTVTVSQDGAEVGTGTTDDAGQWEISLPGPGTYTATLDVAALPEGVVPRTDGAETVEGVIVRPRATQGVIFQLAAAG
ncbi:MAG: carboxypeptidase regulatory-like domain-containing protein, partial [Actinobacteria bacterium]|nr:carboxypeptidase regulatory-like domain-containing protein [Actinomycetota bacterium]